MEKRESGKKFKSFAGKIAYAIAKGALNTLFMKSQTICSRVRKKTVKVKTQPVFSIIQLLPQKVHNNVKYIYL